MHFVVMLGLQIIMNIENLTRFQCHKIKFTNTMLIINTIITKTINDFLFPIGHSLLQKWGAIH
jgi:antibiotic biosynthesis monooxygenase (ABM) superfamily enzyme